MLLLDIPVVSMWLHRVGSVIISLGQRPVAPPVASFTRGVNLYSITLEIVYDG